MTNDKSGTLSRFPQLREAAVEASSIIEESRSLFGGTGAVELEARLGKLENGVFMVDVGKEAFASICAMLSSYRGWLKVEPWTETHDAFYDVMTKDSERISVRTSVCHSSTGCEVKHISKVKLKKVDLGAHSVPSGSCSLSPGRDLNSNGILLDMRISLNYETPISDSTVPDSADTTHFRIKQRQRHWLQSGEDPEPMFVFDLTRTWAGITRTDAEEAQRVYEPCHEVEVECVDPQKYLAGSENESAALALSLIVKLHDFVSALNPGQSITYYPERPHPKYVC